MGNPFEGLRPEPPQPDRKEREEGELTLEEMRKKLRDPSFLPSYRALSKLLKELVVHRHNSEWEKWYNLVYDKKNPIFEIWTKEYIHALGSYLAQRTEELGGTEENPTVILEVGAGNGRLTHFLQEKMNEIIPGKIIIVASDSGYRKIPPTFPVENIPHNEALAKYKPKIVIFSWMPPRYDCTSNFRAAESVDEYILIGEADYGCCGDTWKTWGQRNALSNEEQKRYANQPPPYEADGFAKVYQKDLRDLQLSRLNISVEEGSTTTVSFRKKK